MEESSNNQNKKGNHWFWIILLILLFIFLLRNKSTTVDNYKLEPSLSPTENIVPTEIIIPTKTLPIYSPPTFNGYECTEDCSGHEAGYEWAQENGIDNTDNCGGNSNSFIEGCQSYVEENYPENLEDEDSYYDDYRY